VARILVADDDSDLLALVSKQLRGAGHEVEAFDLPGQAEQRIRREPFDLILTDLEMPELSGIDLLRAAKETDPASIVIILTGHATVETAVDAMKLGAFDYLCKPFPVQELLVVIEKGVRQRELVLENRRLKSELREKYHFANLVGNSAPMRDIFRMVERVGPSSTSVLILGESGTGKELIARALHEISPRSHRRFLKVNCSALAETLLESELFGHERGAFTGAVATTRGLFEAAHGGTLLLDEVGDTPPTLQAKLLRVLQEGEIRRVGGTADIEVDVRVITATNRNLKQRIAEGLFRQDLYYRLNVVSLSMPPLRERRDDIPLLVDHFIRKKGGGLEKVPRPAPEAMEIFLGYAWPGNVRELENAIERALVLCEGEAIEPTDLPEEMLNASPSIEGFPPTESQPSSPGKDAASLEEVEKRHICQVLALVDGHREKASKILGITRRTLYEKIKRYGIEDQGL
jgi:DNA-binding NtrC family response regulator